MATTKRNRAAKPQAKPQTADAYTPSPDERVAACGAAINAALERYRCVMDAPLHLVDGRIVAVPMVRALAD